MKVKVSSLLIARIMFGLLITISLAVAQDDDNLDDGTRIDSVILQQNGYAIERGAELFDSNCSECHGTDGLGVIGKAPALNNPHFFGFDLLAGYNDAILDANSILVNISKTVAELQAEIKNDENPANEERQAEIEAEFAELDAQLEAQIVIIEEAVANRLATLISLQPAIDRGLYRNWKSISDEELTDNLVENGTRLNQVGWEGDLHGYIVTTLIHGRPSSSNVWENSGGMGAWSQLAGGPLRDDEIENLTAYILNWDKGDAWTKEDFFEVRQYAKPYSDGSPIIIDQISFGITYEEINEILADIDDPENGEFLYTVKYGCSACHNNGLIATDTEDIWSVTLNERLTLERFERYTAEQYIVESILDPSAYDYPDDTYLAGAMPANFGNRMPKQDLIDIVQYLKTFGTE